MSSKVEMWEDVNGRDKRRKFMMIGAQVAMDLLSEGDADCEGLSQELRDKSVDMRGRGEGRSKRSCRAHSMLVAPEDSAWAKHYRHIKKCHDSGAIPDRDAKLWRRRFRVPFPAFLDICVKARRAGVGPKSETDACGLACKPFYLKVMGVLRVLGRAHCFDDCAEMSGVPAETQRQFFHGFCRKFTRE